MPAAAERVHDALDQRRLRAHHHQVDLPLCGEAHDAVDVLDRHSHALHPVARDPRVAGRAEQLRLAGRARQHAHERVLAASAPDYQDPRQRQSDAMKSSTGIAVSDS